jgi:hypothetical protein
LKKARHFLDLLIDAEANIAGHETQAGDGVERVK